MLNLRKRSLPFALTALGLIITLCGCRFGNHSDPYTPLTQPGTYKSVDLYFTQAVRLETKVYREDPNDPNHVLVSTNSNTPLVAIPSEVLSTFTNPVYFAVPVDTKKKPMFVGIDESSYVYTGVSSSNPNTIDYTYSSPVVQLWNSPNCGTMVQKIHTGTFDNAHPGTFTFMDGSVTQVKGKLQISTTYTRLFSDGGVCAADLNALATCYLNGSGCSSDELLAANTLFDLYVRQAGLLNLATDDLSKIIGLEYTAYYE